MSEENPVAEKPAPVKVTSDLRMMVEIDVLRDELYRATQSVVGPWPDFKTRDATLDEEFGIKDQVRARMGRMRKGGDA